MVNDWFPRCEIGDIPADEHRRSLQLNKIPAARPFASSSLARLEDESIP